MKLWSRCSEFNLSQSKYREYLTMDVSEVANLWHKIDHRMICYECLRAYHQKTFDKLVDLPLKGYII